MPGQPNPYLALVAPKAPAPENPYLSLVGAPTSGTSGTSGDVDLGAHAAAEPTLPPVVVRAAPPATERSVVPPSRAAEFQQWLGRNRVTDLDQPESRYDYRGAFLAGIGRDPGAAGHFPDTFKQHGHPTFSDESQYSRGPGDGGHWIGETYVPEDRVVGTSAPAPPIITTAPRPPRPALPVAASDATATRRPAPDVRAPVTAAAIQAALPHPSIGGVGPGDVERQRVSRGLVKGDEMEQGRVNLGEALMGAASAFAPHPMGGETSEALAARLSAESERADALRAPTPTTGPGGTISTTGARSAAPHAATSDPAQQSVRFFHGGHAYDGGSRWVTPDLAYAEGYARKAGGGVHYVDLPKDSPHLLKAFDDAGAGDIAPYLAFDAPPDIAARLRPLQAEGTSNAPEAPAPPTPQAPTPDARDLATAGGTERFSGLPLLAKTRAAVRTAYRSALVTPNADAEGEAPGVVAAIHKANAAMQRAEHIGARRTGWVTEGLTPEQQRLWGEKLKLDNLDTEAQRKAAAAAQAQDPAEAAALQAAADRFAAHADALRPTLPAGVGQEPWFQDALAKHRTNVDAPLTADALASGVDPASLRTPSSAYLRLMSTARLDDADIRRAMDATGAAAPGDLKPRGPVLRALLGERPDVQRLFPTGASGARQGPLKPGAGRPAEGPPALRGRVGLTGSSKQATGTAQDYSGDYQRVVAADARDKAVKSARNSVYEEVAKIGRPLDAGELPTPGKQALAFDDTKGLVTGDAGVARFEVSPAVAKAVRRFHAGLEAVPATPAGAAWRRFTGGLTQVQLSGMPVEATSHANTLASIIASVPGEKDVTGKALVAVPLVGAKIAAIREMKGIDFADPATRALESRLADAGALRIESTPHGGILNSAHRWLFGPEGVDVRGRLVLARKYLARDPNATDEQLREFITGKLGNYVRGNSGALVTGLQDSGISAFARFQAARIPSSIRATFGASGLAATGAAQKTGDVANTLWRGTAGTLLGAQALNQMLVHHRSGQNERGHALDVQLGWGGKGAYIVDGKIVRLGDAEAQAMGDNARPLFIPGATLNPVVATGLRATGARDLLFSDRAGPGKLADAARDMTNTALGTVSPAARFLFTAATGRAPYLNSDGTMLKQSPARFNKDQEMADRAKAALASANPATHAFLGEGGEAGGRSLGGALAQDGQLLGGPASAGAKALEFLAPRVLAPGVGGVQNDVSAMARDEREYGDALTDYKAQIRRATGPMQVARIIAEAKADARRAGVSALAVELALTKFAATPEVASAAKREGALRRATARHREVP